MYHNKDLHIMIKKKEKRETAMFWVDLAFEWYRDAMVFCVFILFTYFFVFLFRSNVWKGHLHESNFCDCFIASFFFFLKSQIPKVTWSHIYVKISSQQLKGTLTTAFWKTPYSWRFYGHGLIYVQIVSSRLENIFC